eukprot:jgi/Psemu1/289132/fgenesh1_pg.323_\
MVSTSGLKGIFGLTVKHDINLHPWGVEDIYSHPQLDNKHINMRHWIIFTVAWLDIAPVKTGKIENSLAQNCLQQQFNLLSVREGPRHAFPNHLMYQTTTPMYQGNPLMPQGNLPMQQGNPPIPPMMQAHLSTPQFNPQTHHYQAPLTQQEFFPTTTRTPLCYATLRASRTTCSASPQASGPGPGGLWDWFSGGSQHLQQTPSNKGSQPIPDPAESTKMPVPPNHVPSSVQS